MRAPSLKLTQDVIDHLGPQIVSVFKTVYLYANHRDIVNFNNLSFRSESIPLWIIWAFNMVSFVLPQIEPSHRVVLDKALALESYWFLPILILYSVDGIPYRALFKTLWGSAINGYKADRLGNIVQACLSVASAGLQRYNDQDVVSQAEDEVELLKLTLKKRKLMNRLVRVSEATSSFQTGDDAAAAFINETFPHVAAAEQRRRSPRVEVAAGVATNAVSYLRYQIVFGLLCGFLALCYKSWASIIPGRAGSTFWANMKVRLVAVRDTILFGIFNMTQKTLVGNVMGCLTVGLSMYALAAGGIPWLLLSIPVASAATFVSNRILGFGDSPFFGILALGAGFAIIVEGFTYLTSRSRREGTDWGITGKNKGGRGTMKTKLVANNSNARNVRAKTLEHVYSGGKSDQISLSIFGDDSPVRIGKNVHRALATLTDADVDIVFTGGSNTIKFSDHAVRVLDGARARDQLFSVLHSAPSDGSDAIDSLASIAHFGGPNSLKKILRKSVAELLNGKTVSNPACADLFSSGIGLASDPHFLVFKENDDTVVTYDGDVVLTVPIDSYMVQDKEALSTPTKLVLAAFAACAVTYAVMKCFSTADFEPRPYPGLGSVPFAPPTSSAASAVGDLPPIVAAEFDRKVKAVGASKSSSSSVVKTTPAAAPSPLKKAKSSSTPPPTGATSSSSSSSEVTVAPHKGKRLPYILGSEAVELDGDDVVFEVEVSDNPVDLSSATLKSCSVHNSLRLPRSMVRTGPAAAFLKNLSRPGFLDACVEQFGDLPLDKVSSYTSFNTLESKRQIKKARRVNVIRPRSSKESNVTSMPDVPRRTVYSVTKSGAHSVWAVSFGPGFLTMRHGLFADCRIGGSALKYMTSSGLVPLVDGAPDAITFDYLIHGEVVYVEPVTNVTRGYGVKASNLLTLPDGEYEGYLGAILSDSDEVRPSSHCHVTCSKGIVTYKVDTRDGDCGTPLHVLYEGKWRLVSLHLFGNYASKQVNAGPILRADALTQLCQGNFKVASPAGGLRP